MIKIEKNLSEIPKSLKLPFPAFFPGVTIPRVSKTTHERRMEVIVRKSYIDEGTYDDRYKQYDTRVALENIYNKKCAFCEQRVE